MKRSGSAAKRPIYGSIPNDLIAAKETLRDRLFPSTEESISKALTLRRTKRFQAAPSVNLVGIGVGEKVTWGRRTGQMSLKVLVAKKYPNRRIAYAQRIPAAVDGIPTDIDEVGYPRKFEVPHRQRHRPVPGGVSVGLDLDAVGYRFAGTLGVVVVDREDQQTLYALSNNHILADENRVNTGAGVVQPGTLDGGTPAARVARLTRFVPLLFDNRRNWIDAAIAKFDKAAGADRRILKIGVPTGADAPSLNLLVRKSGRTTGLTEGIIRAVRFDVVNVQYDLGMVRLDDVIVIRGVDGSFSRPGDSGSAIVNPQGKVVALLFGGSDVVTFAIPIRRVLRRFNVRIAT
ncbi:MAG: trypsin-like peptidase domain-containing protein [Armatimonadota bacterium]